MKPYNEISLGGPDRDTVVGAICGALLAAVIVYDGIRLIAQWLAG